MSFQRESGILPLHRMSMDDRPKTHIDDWIKKQDYQQQRKSIHERGLEKERQDIQDKKDKLLQDTIVLEKRRKELEERARSRTQKSVEFHADVQFVNEPVAEVINKPRRPATASTRNFGGKDGIDEAPIQEKDVRIRPSSSSTRRGTATARSPSPDSALKGHSHHKRSASRTKSSVYNPTIGGPYLSKPSAMPGLTWDKDQQSILKSWEKMWKNISSSIPNRDETRETIRRRGSGQAADQDRHDTGTAASASSSHTNRHTMADFGQRAGISSHLFNNNTDTTEHRTNHKSEIDDLLQRVQANVNGLYKRADPNAREIPLASAAPEAPHSSRKNSRKYFTLHTSNGLPVNPVSKESNQTSTAQEKPQSSIPKDSSADQKTNGGSQAAPPPAVATSRNTREKPDEDLRKFSSNIERFFLEEQQRQQERKEKKRQQEVRTAAAANAAAEKDTAKKIWQKFSQEVNNKWSKYVEKDTTSSSSSSKDLPSQPPPSAKSTSNLQPKSTNAASPPAAAKASATDTRAKVDTAAPIADSQDDVALPSRRAQTANVRTQHSRVRTEMPLSEKLFAKEEKITKSTTPEPIARDDRAPSAQNSAFQDFLVPRNTSGSVPITNGIGRYASTQDSAASTSRFASFSVKDLKRELQKLGVTDMEDCVEKTDLINKVEAAHKQKQEAEAKKKVIEEQKKKVEREEKEREITRERVKRDIDTWAKNKSLIAMLNDANEWQTNDSQYLTRTSNHTTIAKAYKLAMLKIHPDKHVDAEYAVQIRYTEMFKEVTAKYSAYKAKFGSK